MSGPASLRASNGLYALTGQHVYRSGGSHDVTVTVTAAEGRTGTFRRMPLRPHPSVVGGVFTHRVGASTVLATGVDQEARGMGDDDQDRTPPRPIPAAPPNLQLPKDYWGAEGGVDEHGNWKGGTVHNPIHDVPIPASLDPGQLHPHHDGAHQPAAPLSADQLHYLHLSHGQLSDAVVALQQAATAEEIVRDLPTVLHHANSAVYGLAGWDPALAAASQSWFDTQPHAGSEQQFQRARDDVVAGGWEFAGQINRWVEWNDSIMLGTEGETALQQLAHVAATAHQQLQPS